ncbi:hypothetical protein [Caballeronia concitans]|uniref:hypothetical protein n=1 Tax=Caballeronia concitans TaxID=1777133 RepID=UPI00117DC3E1|nr:hypothetical protein [Caballeronia concitans]
MLLIALISVVRAVHAEMESIDRRNEFANSIERERKSWFSLMQRRVAPTRRPATARVRDPSDGTAKISS